MYCSLTLTVEIDGLISCPFSRIPSSSPKATSGSSFSSLSAAFAFFKFNSFSKYVLNLIVSFISLNSFLFRSYNFIKSFDGNFLRNT